MKNEMLQVLERFHREVILPDHVTALFEGIESLMASTNAGVSR